MQPSVLRRVLRELRGLQENPLDNIRISINEDDILRFQGIIAGPDGTPYNGGWFRVGFTFGDDFPASPPKCHFITKIFHPNVSPSNGEICVNALKKDWQPNYGIGHILTVIKCLLINPNPDSALDEEAGKMVQDNWSAFEKRAKLMTGIHASRGGRPPEFDDLSPDTDLLGSTPTSTDPLSASLDNPSLPSAKALPASTSTPVPAHPPRRSPSPQLAPPPLQSSAQTNSARSSVPPPSKDEKEKAKVQEGENDRPTAEGMKTAMGSKVTGRVSKGVKRPASAMNSGAKEGNVDKRKRGLKRL